MVDWSAASKPVTGENSIWIAMLREGSDGIPKCDFTNPGTRADATRFISEMVTSIHRRGERVLLGFDFSLGYPEGTAKALGLDTSAMPPWQAMHEFLSRNLSDNDDNSNNRFALADLMNTKMSSRPFPFWGAPRGAVTPNLSAKKSDFHAGELEEFRVCETYFRDTQKGNPKSVWQLAYIGSVGSQSLTGIPRIRDLRAALDRVKIWPFEFGMSEITQNALEETSTLIVEIYPSSLNVSAQKNEILDQAQVRAAAHFYYELDNSGCLGRRFQAPDSLDRGKISQIIAEEGWIL